MVRSQPDQAKIEYEAAVSHRKKLHDSDPGNVPWRTGLATDYTLLGDVLVQQGDLVAAARNYSAAARIVEGFNLTDPNNMTLLRNYAILNRKRGDILVHRANDAADPATPVIDESTRLVGDALARYLAAADAFEKLTNDRRTGTAQYSNLFDVKIKIGDLSVRQHRFKDAADAYQAASQAIDRVAATQHVADWQVRLSAALEETADLLANSAASAVSDYQLAGTMDEDSRAFYQKALDAVTAAAIGDPDNQELQSKKAALAGKLASRQSVAR
jgi:tetratricopeptide (TPR) repeat protein